MNSTAVNMIYWQKLPKIVIRACKILEKKLCWKVWPTDLGVFVLCMHNVETYI